MLGLGLTNYLPIVVYIAGLLVIIVSFVYKPSIGLVFLIPLLPLQNVLLKIHEFPAGKDFIDILVVALFLSQVLSCAREGRRVLDKTRFNLLLTIMIVFTFGELLLGSSFLGIAGVSLSDPRVVSWKNYMMLPLLYLLSVNIVRDRGTIKVMIVVMALSMLLMEYNFYNTFKWVKKWHFTYRMRTSGTFVHLGPNELAAFFVQYTMVLVGLLLQIKEKWERCFLGLVILGGVYCILYSYSRAAYLGLVVGLTFLVAMSNRKLLIIFVIGMCISYQVIPVSVKERISMTLVDEDSADVVVEGREGEERFDASAGTRLGLWEFALESFKRHPILGTGYGTYRFLQGEGRDTHSMYLNVLSEMGLIGLTIVIIIMYLSFKSGWELFRNTDDRLLKGLGVGFCGCVIACVIGNLFGNRWSYIELSCYYWVFLGLVVRGTLIEGKRGGLEWKRGER